MPSGLCLRAVPPHMGRRVWCGALVCVLFFHVYECAGNKKQTSLEPALFGVWLPQTPVGEVPAAICDHVSFACNESTICSSQGYNDNLPESFPSEYLHQLNIHKFPLTWRFDAVASFPRGRAAPYVLFHTQRQQMIMFGGYYSVMDSDLYTDELWIFSFTQLLWQQLPRSSSSPDGRAFGSSAWMSERENHMLVFGGAKSTGNVSPIVWALDVGTWSWASLPTHGDGPPGADGLRVAVVGSTMWSFFGYRCVDERGITSVGGQYCYFNDVFSLNLTQKGATALDIDGTWTRFNSSANSNLPWPRGRVYGAIAVYHWYILYFGGAYADSLGDNYFLDELLAFDTRTASFVEFSTKGELPNKRWSATATLFGNTFVLYGGCNTMNSLFYNDVYYLQIGSEATIDNVLVVTDVAGVAGESSSLRLEMREVVNTTFSGTRLFGSVLEWAIGLEEDFEVVLVSPQANVPVVVFGHVEEVDSGVYDANFVCTVAGSYSVRVEFEHELVPTYGFYIVLPSSISPTEPRVYGCGWGAGITLEEAVVHVQARDRFGNDLFSYNDTSNVQYSLIIRTAEQTEGDFIHSVFVGSGRFTVTYTVPDIPYSLEMWLNESFRVGTTNIIQPSLPTVESWQQVLIGVFLALSFVIAIASLIFGYHYRHHTVLVASSPSLCLLIWFGALLCLCSSITFLAYTRDTCMVTVWLLSYGYTVMIGALLVKSFRIMIIFNAGLRRKKITDVQLCIPIAILIALDTIILSCWTALDPATLHKVTMGGSCLEVELCSSSTLHWLEGQLAWKTCLLFVAIYLAVRTSDLKAQFNESNVIALIVYNIVFVGGLSLVVILILTPEQYALHYFSFQFAILWIVCFTLTYFCVVKLRLIRSPEKLQERHLEAELETLQSRITSLELESRHNTPTSSVSCSNEYGHC